MQGSPLPGHPLTGLVRLFVLDAAIEYALCLEIKELRLVRPTERLCPIYEKMGFDLAGLGEKPPYCSLRLDK
jgi:hypothetical protein